jgi:hypothetical protein
MGTRCPPNQATGRQPGREKPNVDAPSRWLGKVTATNPLLDVVEPSVQAVQDDCGTPKPVWRLIRLTNLRDDGDPIAAHPNVNQLGLRDGWSVRFRGNVRSGLRPKLSDPAHGTTQR